jgi:hypothetical protein
MGNRRRTWKGWRPWRRGATPTEPLDRTGPATHHLTHSGAHPPLAYSDCADPPTQLFQVAPFLTRGQRDRTRRRP